jgi:hypothetical protein
MNAYHGTKRPVTFVLAALFYALACILKAQTITEPEMSTAASELHNHDSAFSLLLETYREFQNNLIQTDYKNQLSAAASLTDNTTRKEVIALAQKERDLRVHRLAAQLVAFSAVYDHSRQPAERQVGVTSGPGVDVKAAGKELEDFVVIAPAADGSQDADAFQALPSSAVLLNNCYNP